MVRLRADRLIHNHLKNEVGATLQVEAEADPAKQCFFQARLVEALGNAKYPIKTENQDDDNAYGFES